MTKINGRTLAVLLVCAATAVASPAKTIFRDLADFDGSNGSFPDRMSLVQGTDGNLYGTTAEGGANGDYGGTVFKITAEGTLTTLYSFCAEKNCTDGANVWAGLVQGADGNFYGTTVNGGANNNNSLCNVLSAGGCGTAYELTPTGKLTTLYNFCSQTNCTDGSNPISGLVPRHRRKLLRHNLSRRRIS
jgi:uncharacterized repeat protein (TIGR03803 family)